MVWVQTEWTCHLLSPSFDFLFFPWFFLRCYAMIGDFKKACYYCSYSCEAVEKAFGSSSVEYAHELHKLSQLLFNDRQIKKALSTIDKATNLLTRHYGRSNPDVKELSEMKRCLVSVGGYARNNSSWLGSHAIMQRDSRTVVAMTKKIGRVFGNVWVFRHLFLSFLRWLCDFCDPIVWLVLRLVVMWQVTQSFWIPVFC